MVRKKQASEALCLRLCRILKWPERGNPYMLSTFFLKFLVLENLDTSLLMEH